MKIKAYVTAKWNSYSNKYVFEAWPWSATSDGEINVHETEIEFDEPPREVLDAGTIKAYRAEQEKLKAETHVKLMRIEEAIQSLLAIEFTPEPIIDDGLPF